MSTQVLTDEQEAVRRDAGKLADFIMFTQRSFLLNLSKELNKGNVSFAQFFLLGYLANEDYLTMTSISKKMGHSTAAATGLVDRLEKLTSNASTPLMTVVRSWSRSPVRASISLSGCEKTSSVILLT